MPSATGPVTVITSAGTARSVALFTVTPAVANGIIYAGSFDGTLYAFGLAGGLATPARPNRTSLHPDYHLPG